jgi:hypothetical protein
MHTCNGSGTCHSWFLILFLLVFLKVMIPQVAVKSLLVYASDVSEVMEKKTKVSVEIEIEICVYP